MSGFDSSGWRSQIGSFPGVLELYEGAMLTPSLNGGGKVLGASEPAIDGALEV